MPSVVVDSVLVESGWDPTALEQGLAQGDRLVQEFVSRNSAKTVRVGVDVNGADVTPPDTAIFEAFSQSVAASFTQLNATIGTLGTAIQALAASGGRAFRDLGTGADAALAPLTNGARKARQAVQDLVGVTAAQVTGATAAEQAQIDLATASLAAAETYRSLKVSEENLNKTLERSNFLTVEAAKAVLELARARSAAASTVIPTGNGGGFSGGGGGFPPNNPPNNPPNDPGPIREIIGQQEQLAATADVVATAMGRLKLGMAGATQQAEALSAAIREQIGFSELQARAAQQAADGLTLQARAAEAAAAANAAAQQAGAGPIGAGLLSTEVTANMLAAGKAAGTMTAGIALAARQTTILAAAERLAGTESGKLIAGMSQSGLAARELAAAQAAAAAASGGLSGASRVTLGSVKNLGNLFAIVESQALGGTSAIGRLAGSLLFMTAGSGPVFGAVAAVGVAALAFELLTASARKAKEELDKASQELERLRQQQLDPITVNIKIVETVGTQLDKVRVELAQLKRDREELAKASLVPGFDPEGAAVGNLVLMDRQIEAMTKHLEELGGQVGAGTFAVVAEQAKRTAQIFEQANQDELSITKAGLNLRQQALEAALALDLITRKDFSDQAIALAEQQSAAQIAALKAQRTDLLLKPTANAGEQQDRDREIAHLTRLIALEEAELAIARQRIETNKAISDAATLVKVQIGPPEELDILPRLRNILLTREEILGVVLRTEQAAAQGKIDDEIQRAIDTGNALLPILDEINLRLRDIGNANIGTDQAERLNDAIHDLTRGLDEVVGASAHLGLIGDEAANAIGSVLSLGDAIGDVVKKASAGNILALVGAGIGFLGTAFGPSEAEIERNRILTENNDLLRQNNAELANQLQGIGGLASLGLTAGQLGQINNVQSADRLGPKGTVIAPEATAALNAILGTAGESLQEFAARVKAATGIDILDSKGRIVGAAFDQAKIAIDAMVDAATHFSKSFGDQLDFTDIQARVDGKFGDATDQFARDLTAAGSAGSDFIAHFFDGIDLKDPQAFQKRMDELLKLFAPDSDFFKQHPELLGGLTVEDWKKILNDGASAMEGLRDKADKASKALGDLNVPHGFRLAALAFETGSRGPDLGNLPPSVPQTPTITIGDRSGLQPKELTPGVTIEPLPPTVQASLDKIASKTPSDLLKALDTLTVTNRQAPRELLDAINAVTAAIQGRDAPEPPAGDLPTGPRPEFAAASTGQRVTVHIDHMPISVTVEGEVKNPEELARQLEPAIKAVFRRSFMRQSGDTLQGGWR